MSNSKIVIESKSSFFNLNLKELIQYRDTIWLFVKRNFSTRYKQTILGPAWLFLSPIFTVFAYSIVFGGIAGLSTDGVPRPLFYLLGIIVWNIFNGIVSDTANTFTSNVGLFGKIYFPRLIVPISNAITKIIDFFIQFSMLLVLLLYYSINGYKVTISWKVILCLLVILQYAMLGIGIGIIISSITTKYRDLMVLVGFGMQIWLYTSPVIYSLQLIPNEFLKLYMCNPVTPGLIIFKHAFLGIDQIPYLYWGISWIVTFIVFLFGIVLFNKVEKTFMDVI